MSTAAPPPSGERPDSAKSIATAISEVSERAQLLVREEIELAKTEVTEKVGKLAKGAVVAVAAGIFLVTALFFVLIGFAFLLYYYLPGNDYTFFWGFFAMAAILVVLGIIAGLIAAKVVKKAPAGAEHGDRRGAENPRDGLRRRGLAREHRGEDLMAQRSAGRDPQLDRGQSRGAGGLDREAARRGHAPDRLARAHRAPRARAEDRWRGRRRPLCRSWPAAPPPQPLISSAGFSGSRRHRSVLAPCRSRSPGRPRR